MLHDVASTGIAELDHTLGGLFWGDNVVFEVADPLAAGPFYRAVAAVEEHYDQVLYVTLSGKPTQLRGFDLIHARPGSELSQPAPLLRTIIERCRHGERNLVLFEAIETMIERWGRRRRRALLCPLLPAAPRTRCDRLLVRARRCALSRLATHHRGGHPMRPRGR